MAIYLFYALKKREKHSTIDQSSYKVPRSIPSAISPRNYVSNFPKIREFTKLTLCLDILSTIASAREISLL